MSSVWRKNRIKAGVSEVDMANHLGVPYKFYHAVEKEKIKMPNNLIEKFNEIVNKGKNINKLESLDKSTTVKEWYSYVCSKNEKGKYRLYEEMNKFNIKTMRQLSELLGYKNQTMLSHMLTQPVIAGYEFKNKLYTFFHDERNIQEPVETKRIGKFGKMVRDEEHLELISWWDTFDIAKFMSDVNIESIDFSKATGVSHATINRLCNKSVKTPTKATLARLKEYVENRDKQLSNSADDLMIDLVDDSMVSPVYNLASIETLETRLIEKYTKVVETLQQQENDLLQTINELRVKIDDILNRKHIYEELLNDIKGE